MRLALILGLALLSQLLVVTATIPVSNAAYNARILITYNNLTSRVVVADCCLIKHVKIANYHEIMIPVDNKTIGMISDTFIVTRPGFYIVFLGTVDWWSARSISNVTFYNITVYVNGRPLQIDPAKWNPKIIASAIYSTLNEYNYSYYYTFMNNNGVLSLTEKHGKAHGLMLGFSYSLGYLEPGTNVTIISFVDGFFSKIAYGLVGIPTDGPFLRFNVYVDYKSDTDFKLYRIDVDPVSRSANLTYIVCDWKGMKVIGVYRGAYETIPQARLESVPGLAVIDLPAGIESKVRIELGDKGRFIEYNVGGQADASRVLLIAFKTYESVLEPLGLIEVRVKKLGDGYSLAIKVPKSIRSHAPVDLTVGNIVIWSNKERIGANMISEAGHTGIDRTFERGSLTAANQSSRLAIPPPILIAALIVAALILGILIGMKIR